MTQASVNNREKHIREQKTPNSSKVMSFHLLELVLLLNNNKPHSFSLVRFRKQQFQSCPSSAAKIISLDTLKCPKLSLITGAVTESLKSHLWALSSNPSLAFFCMQIMGNHVSWGSSQAGSCERGPSQLPPGGMVGPKN